MSDIRITIFNGNPKATNKQQMLTMWRKVRIGEKLFRDLDRFYPSWTYINVYINKTFSERITKASLTK